MEAKEQIGILHRNQPWFKPA